MKARHALRAPALMVRSYRSWRDGRKARIPGLEFDRFGRRLGIRLALSGHIDLGASYWLNPVSNVRYFEFPFTAASVPSAARKCADVGSPRLFSLYWSRKHPDASIEMINPDARDLDETRLVAGSGGIHLHYVHADLRILEGRPATYDAIWAISVIEHVHGAYDDRAAVA